MPERAALIALLIVDRPLCIDCIVLRANTPAPAVEHYLEVIGGSLALLHEDTGRCRACGTLRKVYSLTQPPL